MSHYYHWPVSTDNAMQREWKALLSAQHDEPSNPHGAEVEVPIVLKRLLRSQAAKASLKRLATGRLDHRTDPEITFDGEASGLQLSLGQGIDQSIKGAKREGVGLVPRTTIYRPSDNH